MMMHSPAFQALPVYLRKCLLALLSTLAALAPAVAHAQRDPIPTNSYFDAFNEYYDGEYRDALKDFQDEGRGAIKSVSSRWIDSICYHTMTGECHYQMGRHADALEHYNSALSLYLMYPDWMIRLQMPPGVQPSALARQIPWGRSTRVARLGHIPDKFLIAQGEANVEDKVRRGGVVQAPVLLPINAKEIIRCTTLAMRRRREIMGPVCVHDPLTGQLVAAWARRPGQPNHWSSSWIDLQLGLAYSCAGNDTQAKPLLERSLVVAGEFDHDLTSTGLLELGRIALSQANYEAAARLFEEATYSSVFYWNPGVMEEAFRFGLITHQLANRPGIYPPLEAAADWARVKNLRQLQVSLMLLAAENLATMGQSKPASALLANARPLIANRDMVAGKIGARANYINAMTLYQDGKIPAGDDSLKAALAFQSGGGSLWLFQIGLADSFYGNQIVTPRAAMTLYQTVLRDPTPADWASDPLESLSVLSTPHPLVYEHWFEVALQQRKENEIALEIADAARRHRFLATQALGGRLLSLRWLLEGPTDSLDKQAAQQRSDLRTRYAKFDELSRQAARLRTQLEQAPLIPLDPPAERVQQDALASLGQISALQEGMLREIALRREPADMVFPPPLNTRALQDSLPEKHAVLAFFATSRQMYAFLIGKDKYAGWQLGPLAGVQRPMATMLRQMGNFETNSQVPTAELTKNGWEKPATQLLNVIFKGNKTGLPDDLEELIIVPDGMLWYLPFETLPVTKDGSTGPLISKCRIRYVPMTSLALPDTRGRQASGNTAVVVGKVFMRDEESLAQSTFDELSRNLAGVVALKSPLPAPSALVSSLYQRLLVLDDIVPGSGGIYGWSPAAIDRGQPGGALEQWLTLPWKGPDQIILPGFHTPAENSLKKQRADIAGADMFLSVCGLMASGSRTILLSRWRTGGQTTQDLMREFCQELPHATAAEAWQRSVLLSFDGSVDPSLEPRINPSPSSEPPKASHPFFWSGYMLVDTGTPPYRDDAEEAEVVIIKNAKKPAAANAKADDDEAAEGEVAEGEEDADAAAAMKEADAAAAKKDAAVFDAAALQDDAEENEADMDDNAQEDEAVNAEAPKVRPEPKKPAGKFPKAKPRPR